MQLRLRRSQREGGVISKNVIFCLDARVGFTPVETANIRRYKLHNQVIYNSEAQQQLLARSDAARDGSLRGNLKSLALVAFAATRLHVTVGSLERGQHVECKSLDELLGAEEAIMTACDNLKGYLETAATFDGREVVIDFDSDSARFAASAQVEQVIVASPAPSAEFPKAKALAAAPAEVVQEMPLHVEYPAEDINATPTGVASEATMAASHVAEVPASFYEPTESGSFFSEGPEGDKQKKIMIGVGVALVVLLLLTCS